MSLLKLGAAYYIGKKSGEKKSQQSQKSYDTYGRNEPMTRWQSVVFLIIGAIILIACIFAIQPLFW